jgi:hypothetical protein
LDYRIDDMLGRRLIVQAGREFTRSAGDAFHLLLVGAIHRDHVEAVR